MSGFTVTFNRDGRPVDRDVLRRMNDAIAHRGPDGSGFWVDGPVGLAHQMMHATPESVDETQPALGARGDLVLVYEGLIDNASEIRQRARLAHLHVRDKTDATAILLAYELWQDGCAEHLLGDFAFVIWDRNRKRCFCARDQIGIRPFYYHLDDRLFASGSELRQLLQHPHIRRHPNEGMAAEYLSNYITSLDETLYRDIQRLPAGHSLVISEEWHKLRRYWTFDPGRHIRLGTDEEYGEALREEIRKAVRACGRAMGPLGVELSGGLDSSTVASMARHLATFGELPGPVQTFSVAYPGLACDEGEYVREADQLWQSCTTRVAFELPSKSEFESALLSHHDFPECPNGSTQHPLYRAARDRGCRVLLSGIGGDECLTGHYLHYADLLKQMRLRALRRQLRDDRLGSRALLELAIRPLAPSPLRRAVRALRRGYPDWIGPRFAKRVDLADRLYRPRVARGEWQSRAQEEMFRDMTHGWTYYAYETLNRVLAEHGLELRSPLLRLNVVQYGLAIPEDQRWRRAEAKFVLRQAMKGWLPEKIRTRSDKAEFSAMFPRAFSKLDAASAFRSLRLSSLGWLDDRRVRQMCSGGAAWQPDSPIGDFPVWPLWMIFGAECWLRSAALGESWYREQATAA